MKKIRRYVPVVLAVLVATTAASVAAFQSSDDTPLAAYPGFGHDPVADEEQFVEDEMKREKVIAECMDEAGFIYEPALSVLVDDSMTEAELLAAMKDPNDLYLSSLSPGETEAYNLALYGVVDPNAESSDDLPDFEAVDERSGCVGIAHGKIPGVFSTYNLLRDEFRAMRGAIESDPAVVAAEKDWAACMEGHKYDFDAPSDIRRSLDERALAISQERALTPGDLEALEDDVLRASAIARQCGAETGFEDVIRDVTAVYEAKFVETYKDILESGRRP